MPEVRRQMMPGGGGLGEVVDGFFIRRSASPVAYNCRRTLRSVSDNKENIPASGYARCNRSPLPEWYPRTPLRDVTAIVNALSRRSQRAAACQPRNRENESSTRTPCYPPREMGLFSNSSPSVPSSITREPTAFARTSLEVDTPSSSNPNTPSDLLTGASNAAEVEQKMVMLISIDEIEKVAMKNMRKFSKAHDKKTTTRTRTLLSMR